MEPPLPDRHGRNLSLVSVDLVPVVLATAGIDIDVLDAQPAAALPDETADPEDDDDGEGEVLDEEALDIVEAATGRADGYVELWHLLAYLLKKKRQRGKDGKEGSKDEKRRKGKKHT